MIKTTLKPVFQMHRFYCKTFAFYPFLTQFFQNLLILSESIESIMTTVSSIQIRPKTKEALKKIGKLGDTYNDVIDQLIEEHLIHKSKLQLDGDIRQWKKRASKSILKGL